MKTKEKRPTWQLGEFDKPLVVATYFGFLPIAAPKITDIDIKAVEHCLEHSHYDAAEKAALIRIYQEEDLISLPHPLALAYRRPQRKQRTGGYSLHLIGSTSGIAEALLIRAALSILSEVGYKNLRVDLNCIGDKESLSTYERELCNYIKKFGGNLSHDLKEHLRNDAFNLFRREEEQAIQLRAGAPSAISFLSAQARYHFKEVLEFVEALGVDFGLSPELVGEKNHSSHTIFAVRNSGLELELNPDAEKYLAVGYRYSRLSRRLGLRKEVPMAGVNIYLTEKKEVKVYKELPRPKFYLVQLGREAKIKTLGLIELLRSHRIPVHHFLGKDKLAAQLGTAESLRVPYLIIIGQKEALDGTATIRNMNTRAQETIPMPLLPQFLKNISL